MEYLHKNNELFQEAIDNVVHKTGLEPQVIEKDYYVTMILRGLAKRFDFLARVGHHCQNAIER